MIKAKKYKYIVLLIVLMFVSLLIAQVVVKNKIGKKIDEAGFTYSDLDLNLLFGNLDIEELSYKNQTENLDSIQNRFNINKIKIEGFSYWGHFLNNKIEIDYISAQNGVIHFLPETDDDKESSKSKLISVGKIEVDSILLVLIGEKNQIRWKRSNMLLSRFSIDTLQVNENKDIQFHVSEFLGNKFEYQHSLNLHKISASTIELEDTELSINDFNIKPLKNRAEFKNNTFGRKEMFNLQTNSVKFINLDWQSLFGKGKIVADNLLVNQPKFSIFSDENIPRIKPKSYKALPTIRTLGSSLKYEVQNAEIVDAYIKYERHAMEREESGHLYWESTNAKINNITNDSSAIATRPLTKFDIKSKFMGKANLQIYATFDLTSSKSEYELALAMDSMPMLPFNQILEDVSGVRIKNGDIQSLKMDIKANEYHSKGTLDLLYNDLKVRMLNGNDRESKNPLKWMGSRLLIRKNNFGSSIKKGEINIERDDTATIWHQLWTSIFDGFKSIVFPAFMDGK